MPVGARACCFGRSTVSRASPLMVRFKAYFPLPAMQTTLLSSKGQVIIPKTVRVARRWGPGTRLEVQDTPEGVLLRHVVPASKVDLGSGLAAIRRRVDYRGPALSVAQMDAAVLRLAANSVSSPTSPPGIVRKPSRPSPR